MTDVAPDPTPIPDTPAVATPARPGGTAGLAVRHRPLRFTELVGQRHVAAVLREAARSQQPPQQILLSGGSGLGKTTAARIFAAALLCGDPQDGDACGTCGSCTQVRAGNHPDVIEMDAASNGGKDEVNDLAARARTMPLEGRWKVYIVDEAHGLSRAGGEAFLKLLEEPPTHVIFVLATTDPEKMLATNRGRCLELELTPPTEAELAEHLVRVADQEGWSLPDWAAAAVVSRADPRLGVRGVVMALAKLAGPLGRGEPITEALLAEYLAWLPQHRLAELVAAITAHEPGPALAALAELQRSVGDEAVRQALIAWGRAALQADPGATRPVWVLETIAAAPPGPLWSEALVARLASPTLDGTPGAVAALVEEARGLLGALEAATERAQHHAAVVPHQPTSAGAEPAAPVPVGASLPASPSGSGAPTTPPTVSAPPDDAPPYDPAYDEPPGEYSDEAPGPPPGRTPGPARRPARTRRDAPPTHPVQEAAPASPASPARPSRPGPSQGGSADPWFDNPDAYDTRATPVPGAPGPAGPAPSAPPAPGGLPEGDPATPDEVMQLLEHRAPASAQLLRSCQLVMRDGALFVVVPERLADAARRSPLRQDLATVAGKLPVHYRVRR